MTVLGLGGSDSGYYWRTFILRWEAVSGAVRLPGCWRPFWRRLWEAICCSLEVLSGTL